MNFQQVARTPRKSRRYYDCCDGFPFEKRIHFVIGFANDVRHHSRIAVAAFWLYRMTLDQGQARIRRYIFEKGKNLDGTTRRKRVQCA